MKRGGEVGWVINWNNNFQLIWLAFAIITLASTEQINTGQQSMVGKRSWDWSNSGVEGGKIEVQTINRWRIYGYNLLFSAFMGKKFSLISVSIS